MSAQSNILKVGSYELHTMADGTVIILTTHGNRPAQPDLDLVGYARCQADAERIVGNMEAS